MENKYLVKSVGIGDLIFFCASMIHRHKKLEKFGVKISNEVLEKYVERSNEYEIFCKDFIKYFLSDYDVSFLSNNEETNSDWVANIALFDQYLSDDVVKSTIKKKLNIYNKNFGDYIVIVTKVRGLDSGIYELISSNFFSNINRISDKIFLLGERKIIYGEEYSYHGKNLIYTIYDDCVHKLQNDKVIDLTSESYIHHKYSLHSILEDISLIFNSKHTFILGGGGFFCLSLFSDKLISLVNWDGKKYFRNFEKIFSDIKEFNSFIEKL
jgi:hypothetical protein